MVKKSLRMIRTAPDIALLTPSFKGGLGLKSIMDNIEIQLIDSCHYLLNHYQNVYGCRTFIQILLNQMAILQRSEIILNFDIVKQNMKWPTVSSSWIKYIVKVFNKHRITVKTNEKIFNLNSYGVVVHHSLESRRELTYINGKEHLKD